MKKLMLLSLILIATVLYASTSMHVPDKKFLVKTEFYFSCCGIGGAGITFLNDNNFTMTYNIDGGSIWYNEGKYEIAASNVLLHPARCFREKGGPAIKCSETTGEAVCNLVKNDDSVYYSLYLLCRPKILPKRGSSCPDTFEYPVPESRVREGETRYIQNVKVITMGWKSAVTTAKVKIRERPSVSAKEIEYRLYPDFRSPFVPEKESVTVYARTAKKEKIQNWENYWYFVKAGLNDGAWMFGEFIKLEK